MEKQEELSNVQEENTVFVVKERTTNEELQDARKELITILMNQNEESQYVIGVRMMGLIEAKPFMDEMKKRFTGEEVEINAMMLCSLWENYLQDPDWHPFTIFYGDDGNTKHGTEPDPKKTSATTTTTNGKGVDPEKTTTTAAVPKTTTSTVQKEGKGGGKARKRQLK
ncbi:hypothetical protein LWI29_034136 [Acer saccharum]|uniref:Factor of DNA methylation 1-5/IDN2 domain-containing protein n=1 Tax=Acer saccharum TaxID=4024 RepID=A0AA39VW27_ACESA|nr:hypothetical protein LWI29_034136 [Acer saccharum]